MNLRTYFTVGELMRMLRAFDPMERVAFEVPILEPDSGATEMTFFTAAEIRRDPKFKCGVIITVFKE